VRWALAHRSSEQEDTALIGSAILEALLHTATTTTSGRLASYAQAHQWLGELYATNQSGHAR